MAQEPQALLVSFHRAHFRLSSPQPPGKWGQPWHRGVGGTSLWDPSSIGSPQTMVSLMTAPHSTPASEPLPSLPAVRQNKAEILGIRLPPANAVGVHALGGRWAGCWVFWGFVFFYTYETDISNPIPSQAHRHPLTHSLSHAESPSLTLGSSPCCGKDLRRPPQYIQITSIPLFGGR